MPPSTLQAPALGERVRSFLTREVWERDYSRVHGAKGFVLRQFQVFLVVLKGARENQVRLRAASLSYESLLSIIPFFAVIFALFHAVGGLEPIKNKLQMFIFENVAIGSRDQFAAAVEKFLGNIHGGALGALGSALLIYTAIQLMGSMEESFNHIWGLRRNRSFLSKFVIYWCMITVGPILLAASLAGTSVIQAAIMGVFHMPGLVFLLSFLPWIITIGGFTFLYIVIPNTGVQLRPAFYGGVVAGVCFEFAKLGYAWAAGNLFKYSAVYGSLGAIPVFIVWVRIAWFLVLFGCQITFAYQNFSTIRQESQSSDVSPRLQELVAVRLMIEICCDFFREATPPTAPQLSARVGVPVRVACEVLAQLTNENLTREWVGEDERDPGYMPARALERLTVLDVINVLRSRGADEFAMLQDDTQAFLVRTLGDAEAKSFDVFAELDFAELAKRFTSAEDSSVRPIPHPDAASS